MREGGSGVSSLEAAGLDSGIYRSNKGGLVASRMPWSHTRLGTSVLTPWSQCWTSDTIAGNHYTHS